MSRVSIFSQNQERFASLKTRVHQKLLSVLNMDAVKAESRQELRREVQSVLEKILREDHLPISMTERNRLAEEILDEVFGLGPLEPLLKDPTISDILVNTHKHVYIERHGKLIETSIRFQNDRHLLHIIEKIVSSVGRRIDESVPLVDARLQDGSRVNAIIPPLAVDGPSLSIRRFGRKVLTNEELLRNQTLTPSIMTFLAACVEARFNMVISGGTGSGKTTFLNCLSRFIPEHERVVTIEDTAELQLQLDDVVRMETRPPNIEGKGAITQRQLLMTALRLRPDRILLGEARGGEALDMLQAMGTGVEGSMTTVHANSPADAFSRLETMVMMAKLDLPSRFIRQQMASVIHLLVQTARLSDGTRKVTHVAEVTGLNDLNIQVRDIFIFDQTGVAEDGRVLGRFQGTMPSAEFMERLRLSGTPVSPEVFDEVVTI
ncbi:MAG: pilus assembly protein CpaF [Acidobacteria bacterium]|nr:MAG: pilus assembly protein CpaF [Acidobacteriota bacterium]PYS10367.1 MAG: pilus assembly protein CpaF [Acidobacteriota bacterium]